MRKIIISIIITGVILFTVVLVFRNTLLDIYIGSVKAGVYIKPDPNLREFEYGKLYKEPYDQYIVQGRLIKISDEKVVIYGGGTRVWALNLNKDTYYRHQKLPANGKYYLPDEGISSFTYPDRDTFLADIERFMWVEAECKDFKCEQATGIIILSSKY